MMYIEYLKTIYLNFKHLWNLINKEIQILTAERMLGKELMKKVVKNPTVLSQNVRPNPELLEKYKKLCEQ